MKDDEEEKTNEYNVLAVVGWLVGIIIIVIAVVSFILCT